MQNRTRILLPLAQVAVAAALMTHNALVPDSLANPAFTKPDWQFCLGLNAPATLVARYPMHILFQSPWPRYPFSAVLELIVRLSLIWLLWYVVSIEIDGRGHSILAPKTRMRKVADVLALAFGVVVGATGQTISSRFDVNYGRLVAAPYIIWAVVIIGFYGRDLWVSFARQHELARR
jgi:hypothetical protein